MQNLELRFHSTQFGAAPVAVDPNAAAVLLSHRLSLCACVCVVSCIFMFDAWGMALVVIVVAASLYIFATEILLFCVCFVLHFVSYL